MAYNRLQYIDHFFEEISSGRLEFSDIKKKMTEENIDEDEIKIVFRIVDNMIQKKAVTKASNSINRNLIFGGLLIFTLGSLITVSTYLRVLDIGGNYIIAFGPILAGAVISITGYRNLKKE